MYINIKHNNGFTLIELVISVVIVAILSLISGYIYKTYVERAKETEMYTTVRTIIEAEKIYAMDNGCFASNIFELPIQLEGTEVNINGKRGIKTKYYVFVIDNEYEYGIASSRHYQGNIYVYPGNDNRNRVMLTIYYITDNVWGFGGYNMVRGELFVWIRWVYGDPTIEETKKIYEKFNYTIW